MAHRILVPFELPDASPLSRLLIEDLVDMEVVLLGHYDLPEQTPPDAARDQFEDDATAELEALAADFRKAGVDVTTRLVFGKDRGQAIDDVALDEGCDAELDPAPTDGIERILVPLPDTENLDRICDYVWALLEDGTTAVTLFHVEEDGDDLEPGRRMLAEARDRLVDLGLDPSLVEAVVEAGDSHDRLILEQAAEHDAVVMGEASPAIANRVFGTLPDRIANRTGNPVIIVRRHG